MGAHQHQAPQWLAIAAAAAQCHQVGASKGLGRQGCQGPYPARRRLGQHRPRGGTHHPGQGRELLGLLRIHRHQGLGGKTSQPLGQLLPPILAGPTELGGFEALHL